MSGGQTDEAEPKNGGENAGRFRRWGRRLLVFVLLLPLLIWAGVLFGVKLTVARDVPLPDLIPLVTEGLFGSVVCAVTGCEAELAAGLEIETWTDEFLLGTPVSLEIDESGRVYVAETSRQNAGAEDNRSHSDWLLDDLASRTIEDRQRYYEKAIAEGRIEDPEHFVRESDRLVRLEDRNGDGKADHRVVLAEWNEMVSGLVAGVEAREDTLWVTSIPSVYRLEEPEEGAPAEELLRGFGVKTSLIGHDLHGLAWGPDGRLYFSMGDRGYSVRTREGRLLEPTLGPGRGAVFRMNPDGSGLEVFATGVRNPQELAFDAYGNLFTGDNNGDGGDRARLVYLVEGGETGWAMPYQSLAGDYIRGPWVAEKLWELQHPTQPAWVLPPVAYIGNGPAGFVHYPGLGLPDRYADHFFLCDYAYTRSRTGIWSFAVEPRGATFEMVDAHPFAWSVLATDFDFGWDGRMYASLFNQLNMSQGIAVLAHEESRRDPRLAELETLVSRPIAESSGEALLGLLDFPDQRLRLRAQFELARRGETAALVARVLDRDASALSRRHALWAIGQIGAPAFVRLAPVDLEFARDESDEFRAQLARVAGEAKAVWLRDALVEGLRDRAPRVRFFSAQSLGALAEEAGPRARAATPETVSALFGLIRENADEDVYLRHAAVWALHRLGAADQAFARRLDPSRSVRLAALLVLRHADDPRIADFLEDEDPLLVVEAARAIYDRPIEAAMSRLAALAGDLEGAQEEDRQTSQALHRRVLGANVRLRSAAGATALARYAADEKQLRSLRERALEALGGYAEPSPRDWTMGFYRPLEAFSQDRVAEVFRREGRALIDSTLGARAVELASQAGALPLSDPELVAIVSDEKQKSQSRVSALRALRARTASADRSERPVDEDLRGAVEAALSAEDAPVRMAGRSLLFEWDPEQGKTAFLRAAIDAASTMERQQAFRTLGELRDPASGELLREALGRWRAATLDPAQALDPAVALDVLEAASRRPEPALSSLAKELLRAAPDSPVESRGWALAGGDVVAGQLVFETYGDCQRCHVREGTGHLAGVGPNLSGVASRGAPFVLESIVSPQAEIKMGFGNVWIELRDGTQRAGSLVEETAESVSLAIGTGEPLRIARSEIVSMTGPTSGMPPIGLGLEPRALRDLVAYVMSLD